MTRDILIDEFSKLRILDPQSFDASQKLKDTSADFIQRVTECQSSISYFFNLVTQKQKAVEQIKSQVVGLRLQIEKQQELTTRRVKVLETRVEQKRQELKRVQAYVDSLEQTKREQLVFIDSLGK